MTIFTSWEMFNQFVKLNVKKISIYFNKIFTKYEYSRF